MASSIRSAAKRTVNSFVSTSWLAGQLRASATAAVPSQSRVKVVDATTTSVNAKPAAAVTTAATSKTAAAAAAAAVKVVDASWFMPSSPEKGFDNYVKVRIPGARFFDVDGIADHTSGLPHMMPTNQLFSKVIGQQMGITNNDHIVVYDSKGLFSAARVWWTFRMFGARNVSILEGGLPAWLHENNKVDSGPPSYSWPSCHFNATYNGSHVKTLADMKANLQASKPFEVMDARSQGRFYGRDAEPRVGLRGGHIPGSRNLPFTDVITDAPFVTLKPEDELLSIFATAGIDLRDPNALSRPLTATCGSGMTAAIIAFAAHSCGHKNLHLYDGSWTEWGANLDVPAAK